MGGPGSGPRPGQKNRAGTGRVGGNRQVRIAKSIVKSTTKGKIGKSRRATILKHRLKAIPFRWNRK